MRQDEVWKGYYCAYQIHYHIVFPVKYRKALLSEEITQAIRDIAMGIQERYAIEIEQIGCDRDHIHLLCGAHPKYAPGQLVRVFKSVTARELFNQFPGLKEDLWGGEFWTDGYYVATVGERGNWKVVERYIREQGKRRYSYGFCNCIPCGLAGGFLIVTGSWKNKMLYPEKLS